VDAQGETDMAAAAEHRRATRTNLFLAATLDSKPVRIRNVSETGALIEGDGLPGTGAHATLARGELAVTGEIVWASGSRRGLHFDGPVAVEAWAGGKPRPLDCTGRRDQRRVDSIQAEIRSGGAGPALPKRETVGDADDRQIMTRLAEEIAYVRRHVEAVGDALVSDPSVVHRHLQTLQGIDMANQILAHIADILVAPDRAAAIDGLGMEDLRTRLTRKSLWPS
jgi:hypothetical protein